MNYPRLFCVSLSIILLPGLSVSQSVEEDMRSLKRAYEKGTIIQRVTYSFESNRGKNDTTTSKMGWIVSKSNCSFTFLDAGTTIIQNDSISVMIDDPSRSLVVLPNYKQAATSSSLDKIQGSIEQADSIRLLSNLKAGLRGYRFWLSKPVKVVMDIVFSDNTYLMKYVSTAYPEGTGLNLKVSYEVKELPKKLAGKDKLSEYIILVQGQFAPAPSYTNFEFVNGWNK
ncbi:MAG: hypothetical protein COB85_06610 [Bacteroidetes bacterium]|nr:MAG: hypothetical protein COB85_06610 [Bacteroidota bacterium]